MTLAITEFEALCGFVAHDVLVQNLSKVPELRAAAGEDASAAFVAAPSTATLRQVFTAVMTASAETVSESISSLVSRLRKEDKSALSPVDALALRLETQYPGDVGVLCAYLLNYVTLRPGQCIYLAANEPHAYLQGECVECMATSDNVVRAGLTPKLRDTAILCDMLTYNAGEPTVLDGDAIESEPSGATKSNATVRRYVPPFDEFQLETYEVEAGSTCLASVSPGPCVFLVFGGAGEMGGEKVARGSVVFAKADEAVSITAGEEAIVAYRAMINSRVFA
jgi:mannose-6-phosphate isomerase